MECYLVCTVDPHQSEQLCIQVFKSLFSEVCTSKLEFSTRVGTIIHQKSTETSV